MTLDIHLTPNSEELRAALQRADIFVPGRTKGRKTHHTEAWTISRLLSTLANAGGLSYPLSLNHRDKPDFLIEMGTIRIGVEVTEANPQRYAKYCALADREFPGALLETGHFGWDAPERSTEEMRQLLRQRKLTSEGWIGDRPEHEWALFVQNVVETKLAKLAQPEFGKFDRDWVSVYDNLPLPNVHLGEAISFLRPLLQDIWSRAPSFDTLFIEHGTVIAKITANSSEHLSLDDLWE